MRVVHRFLAPGLATALTVAGCFTTSCFVRGTRIATPRGPRPIEDLVVGDEVFSYSLPEARVVVRTVARCLRARSRAILRVAAGELVIAGTTPEHPFWDAAAGEWRETAALTLRSELLAWLGEDAPRRVPVTELRALPERGDVEVFNLSIAGDEQNYFAEGILVHNKSPRPPPGAFRDGGPQNPDSVEPVATATIGPDGGVIEVPDVVRIEVPPGALPGEQLLQIRPFPFVQDVLSTQRVGDAYQLSPDGVAFAVPLTVSFTVDPARLPAGASLADVSVMSFPDFGQLGESRALGSVARRMNRVRASITRGGAFGAAVLRRCIRELGASYESCGAHCLPGYHQLEVTRSSESPPCVVASRCARDEGDAFESCETGCGAGYHLVGPASALTCPGASARCERNTGDAYETCEQGCRRGYRESGTATIDCTHLGADATATRCEPAPAADAGAPEPCYSP